MSSINFSLTRKRLRSPDFGDSDGNATDNEAPPPKLRKETKYKQFTAIKEKFQNMCSCFKDSTVKNFLSKMYLSNGNSIDDGDHREDDEDVDEVIPQKVVKPDPEKLNPLVRKFGQLSYSSRDRRHLEMNGSYPKNSYCDPIVNRFSSRDWNYRYDRNGCSKLSTPQTNSSSGMIGHPKNGMDLCFGAKPKVCSPESDDIEILSEMPGSNQKQIGSKKSHVSNTSAAKDSAFDDGQTNTTRQDFTSVKNLQFSSHKGYTADEVLRLQEKEKYKVLLDKFLDDSYRQYMAAKTTRSTDFHTSVQHLPPSERHFNKEVVHVDKETYEKQFKPAQLLPLNEAKRKEPPIEIVKIDDSGDDDLQIIKEVILPKYKQSKSNFRQMMFSAEWLKNLKQCVHAQKAERLQIVENQERQLEEYRKKRLRIPLQATEQVVNKEFPPITPEMEDYISSTLHSHPLEGVVCKLNLLRKDVETLCGLTWLNDLVINAYFDMIVLRSKKEGYPSVHAFNTFFYSTLKAKGYSSVRRWTRKIDIFSFDINFVPIHLGVHWALCAFDHRSKKVLYYDSMGKGEIICLGILHNYLCQEHMDKKGVPLDPSDYAMVHVQGIPQQMNGSDCGMYSVRYAEYISRDAPITFNQSHMAYFRRRTMYELLKCDFL